MTSLAKETWEFIDIPLFNPIENIDRIYTSETGLFPTSGIVNYYPRVYINKYTGKNNIFLSRREGISKKESSTVPTTAAATGTGIFYWDKTGKVYLVQGTDLGYFTLGSTTYTSLTTTYPNTSTQSIFTEFFNGSTYELLVRPIGASVSSKSYTISTGNVLTEITDVDFPNTTAESQFVTMDGYVFILTNDGKLYNSDLGSSTSWSSTSFIQCNQTTDNGTGLAKYKNTIVAFGNNSIEFFYDAANPNGSPLKSNESLNITGIGCSSASTIQELDNTIYWVDKSKVYVLNNEVPKEIGDSFINTELQLASSHTTKLSSGSFWARESLCYCLTILKPFAPEAITFLYHTNIEGWSIQGLGSNNRTLGHTTDLISIHGTKNNPSANILGGKGIYGSTNLSYGYGDLTTANTTDGGITYISLYLTRYLDLPIVPIRIHKVLIYYDLNFSPIVVNNLGYFNKLSQFLFYFSGDGSYLVTIGGKTRTLSSTTNMNEIYKITVYYSVCEH